MSIFHRRQKGGTAVLEREEERPPLAPRQVFPRGPFAHLVTDPPEVADLTYAAFMRNELTPVIAEREIAHILADYSFACPPIEDQPMFQYALTQETTQAGRLRVFVHFLVHLQNAHESNRRSLHLFERSGVRRVMILPGCCAVCDELANRRFRISQAPDLPVDGCQRHGGCICAWAPTID